MLGSEARGEGGTFFAFTPGGLSCGKYLRAAEGERKARPAHPEPDSIYSMDYLSFLTFANGYLTGVNWAIESGVGHQSDVAGRMKWLENYCTRNPLDEFAVALMMLREYLVEHGQ